MRMTKTFIFSFLSALAFSSTAYAHGLAVYASTPVTPPKGWYWIPILFVAGTIIWDWYALGKTVPLRRLIWREVLFLGVFALVFFVIGFGCANANTAPPPGLGLPHRAFHGMPLLRGGIVFLFFNALGLTLFLGAKKLLCVSLRPSDADAWKKLRRAGATAYMLAMVPYMLANAMTHGWAGGYVNRTCLNNMAEIGYGLVRYAEQNDGKLPEAESTEAVMQAIEPHFDEGSKCSREPSGICPVEEVYKRHPRPYEWNPSFSGVMLIELEEGDSNEPVLRCTTAHTFGESPAIYAKDLLKKERLDILKEIRRRVYADAISALEKKMAAPP